MQTTKSTQGRSERVPYLQKQGNATQLYVDGSPFLILGGELHNSSSSSIEYMKPIWERMVDLNFNTVLAPVSWELIEPEEGHFDFALVDGLIQDARRYNLRLVFLWFGSWKNGMSSYVPLWVKKDYRRFPRVQINAGETVEVLSTLAEANWQADARAFAALMRHIRDVDGDDHTVIMVQVENEVGVLGDSRDRSEAASRAFAGQIPQELLQHVQQRELVPELRERWEQAGRKTSGTWEEVFGAGPETDEIFMAWHYARYVDHVAAAGKAEYDIPMYVNAWLSSPELQPGDWPSGGPLPHTMDVWLAGAPHIDMLTPDIYQPNFEEWCEKYTQHGNPLFIPEMRHGDDGARNIFYAIGQHEAIGTSPFAVDSIEDPKNSALSASYRALQQVASVILAHQGANNMVGFLLDEEHPNATRVLGAYELEIALDAVFQYKAELGYGLVIATGSGEFVGVGSGFCVTFRPISGVGHVGLGAVDEGEFRNGKWIAGRRLNGDENAQGLKWRFGIQRISIERCTVYNYE